MMFFSIVWCTLDKEVVIQLRNLVNDSIMGKYTEKLENYALSISPGARLADCPKGCKEADISNCIGYYEKGISNLWFVILPIRVGTNIAAVSYTHLDVYKRQHRLRKKYLLFPQQPSGIK